MSFYLQTCDGSGHWHTIYRGSLVQCVQLFHGTSLSPDVLGARVHDGATFFLRKEVAECGLAGRVWADLRRFLGFAPGGPN